MTMLAPSLTTAHGGTARFEAMVTLVIKTMIEWRAGRGHAMIEAV